MGGRQAFLGGSAGVWRWVQCRAVRGGNLVGGAGGDVVHRAERRHSCEQIVLRCFDEVWAICFAVLGVAVITLKLPLAKDSFRPKADSRLLAGIMIFQKRYLPSLCI